MEFHHWLFLVAAAVVLLSCGAMFGRGAYADYESMSVDDWKRLWARLTDQTRDL